MQAVIYVVDSTDKVRICVVKDELEELLRRKELARSLPVLFFANKVQSFNWAASILSLTSYALPSVYHS